jgi:protein-tyrosine phosphatase
VQRRWSPDTAVNFRDLGGQPTADGGRVRAGMLYRSASPQFLTTADATRLVATTGLRLVVDLRFEAEAEAEGSGGLSDTSVRRHHVPIVGAGGDVVANAVLAGDGDLLGGYYATYVQHNPAAFVDIFRTLAAADALPALLHCAVGKDRTGVVVALVLSTLDVPEDAIVADYTLTAEHMPNLLRRLASSATYGPSLEVQDPDDPMTKAHPESMRLFLGWLRREHGSATEFLLRAGLEPEALDILRHRLVDRAAA